MTIYCTLRSLRSMAMPWVASKIIKSSSGNRLHKCPRSSGRILFLGWITVPSIISRCSKLMNSIYLQASLLTARSRSNAAQISGSPVARAAAGPFSKQIRAKRSRISSCSGSSDKNPVVMRSFTVGPSRSNPLATRWARAGSVTISHES